MYLLQNHYPIFCIEIPKMAFICRIACSLLIVGPEGDFTEEEQTQMVRAGATCVGLGSNRLRVETAAIAMLSAFQILCANE